MVSEFFVPLHRVHIIRDYIIRDIRDYIIRDIRVYIIRDIRVSLSVTSVFK